MTLRRNSASRAWPFLVVLLPACWGSLDQRAALDEQVGIGQLGGVAVQVSGGLAAITRLQPGAIVLWAQAPELHIALDASAPAVEQWILTVNNIIPGSTLQGRLPDGSPVELMTVPDTEPCLTRQSWAARVSPGLQLALDLVAPMPASPGPLRFAVINDPHGAGKVQQYIPALNADGRLAFVVSSGDVCGGETVERMLEVQQSLCGLRVPFYATPGNSEAGDDHAWHQVFGRHSFHFDFRDVAFSFADSSSASLAPVVYDWLDGWMEQSRKMLQIFVSHVPPLDPLGSRNGGFRSRDEAGKLLAHLARGGMDLLVLGHLHNFHQVKEGGILTVISGGGHGLQPYVVVDADPGAGTLSVARVSSAQVDE